jgi:hypothetical protein
MRDCGENARETFAEGYSECSRPSPSAHRTPHCLKGQSLAVRARGTHRQRCLTGDETTPL